ncbi:MAG: 1-(5-phosphoribosyl)-5-[Oscillospiraceae bacterium]|nr:1-(5-phosphoribosyl)-5-[(5-phosphoribosylamino)methylideneamino]imidazole-4-carboxamide isomerase [Oscillospiraceae bacterium]
MILFPAIDLYNGCAVRLLKGDYQQMTVYSDHPLDVARDFEACGAEWIHMVDLEGAKDGTAPNMATVAEIARSTALKVEIGGGIRSMEVAQQYLDCGVARIVLGTAAVKDRAFLCRAIEEFGDKLAVGVDVKDGSVAIHGWTESSGIDCFDFCRDMAELGVHTIICTDISKDGAMAGTNRELYRQLSQRFSLQITASGGVSSMDDIVALRKLELYGAIIGKAYYTGAISLRDALEAAK